MRFPTKERTRHLPVASGSVVFLTLRSVKRNDTWLRLLMVAGCSIGWRAGNGEGGGKCCVPRPAWWVQGPSDPQAVQEPLCFCFPAKQYEEQKENQALVITPRRKQQHLPRLHGSYWEAAAGGSPGSMAGVVPAWCHQRRASCQDSWWARLLSINVPGSWYSTGGREDGSSSRQSSVLEGSLKGKTKNKHSFR